MRHFYVAHVRRLHARSCSIEWTMHTEFIAPSSGNAFPGGIVNCHKRNLRAKICDPYSPTLAGDKVHRTCREICSWTFSLTFARLYRSILSDTCRSIGSPVEISVSSILDTVGTKKCVCVWKNVRIIFAWLTPRNLSSLSLLDFA